jgi:hypothetical protein
MASTAPSSNHVRSRRAQGCSRSLTDEGRAQAGPGVGGPGGSAAPKDQDDDDQRARDRDRTEAGGKRHEQRCVTYEYPTTGIESQCALG